MTKYPNDYNFSRKPSSEESEVNKCDRDRSNIKVTVVLRYTKAKIGTKRVFLAGSMTQWKTIGNRNINSGFFEIFPIF